MNTELRAPRQAITALTLRIAMAAVLLGAETASAADSVSLVCTGRRTTPDASTGAMRAEGVAFRLTLDDARRRIREDGKTMVVRDWTPERLVYSDYNPGILAALAGGVVTTVDLKTGAWRNKWGSGRCKAEGRTER
jgi:hypothetical protein